MALRFVVVPQWQGSPSPRAMRLAEGSAAIRVDLPASSTTEVAVPLEAGDECETGISRFSSLQLVRERLADELAPIRDVPVVIGGDCGVSDTAVARAAALDDSPLAVVWFDAHPDLNTPATSPSGAYAGMVLGSLVERGVVPPDRVVLAGARSWDPGETGFAEEHGIRTLSVEDLADPVLLLDSIAATGAERVYLHIDLDVLDPALFASLLDPAPFGLEPAVLVAAVRAVAARYAVVGATIADFAPGSPADASDDAPTILRLIAALGR